MSFFHEAIQKQKKWKTQTKAIIKPKKAVDKKWKTTK